MNSAANQRKLQTKVKLVEHSGQELALHPIDLSETMPAATGLSEAAVELDPEFAGAKPGKYMLVVETSETGAGAVAAAQTDIEITGY